MPINLIFVPLDSVKVLNMVKCDLFRCFLTKILHFTSNNCVKKLEMDAVGVLYREN